MHVHLHLHIVHVCGRVGRACMRAGRRGGRMGEWASVCSYVCLCAHVDVPVCVRLCVHRFLVVGMFSKTVKKYGSIHGFEVYYINGFYTF